MLQAATAIDPRARRGSGDRALAARLAALTLAGASRPRFASELEQREAALLTKIWLGFVDDGRHALSWSAAAPPLRDAVPEVDWVLALRSTRAPLGRCLSRRPVSTTSLWGLASEPREAFVVTRFESRFEADPDAVELVTAVRCGDGAWRATSYFIEVSAAGRS